MNVTTQVSCKQADLLQKYRMQAEGYDLKKLIKRVAEIKVESHICCRTWAIAC